MILSFGETLLRLTSPVGERIGGNGGFDVFVAGSESNVAASLSRLGHEVGFLTAFPDNALGWRAAEELRRAGVHLNHVEWLTAARMGTFFAEYGNGLLPTDVMYDREHSAFRQLSVNDFAGVAWEEVRHLHISGISLALGDNIQGLTASLIDKAKAVGATVSLDVNFRSKLWSGEEAAGALHQIADKVDIVFCANRDADIVFMIEEEATDVALLLTEIFQNAQRIIVSDQENGAVEWVDGIVRSMPALPVDMVDRFGAGDALAAGYLHGWVTDSDPLLVGVGMAALALSQCGDMPLVTQGDIERIIAAAGEGGPRIMR